MAEEIPFNTAQRTWKRADLIVCGTPQSPGLGHPDRRQTTATLTTDATMMATADIFQMDGPARQLGTA